MNFATYLLFILFSIVHANAVAHQGHHVHRRRLFWDWIVGAVNTVEVWGTGAINDIGDFGEDAINEIGDFGADAIDGISNFGEDAAEWTVGAATDVGDWTVGAVNDIEDVTVGAAVAVGEWTVGAAEDVADFAEDVFEDAKEVAEEAGEWIVEAAKDIKDWAEDAAQCVVNIYTKATDQCVLDAMQSAIETCWESNGKNCRFEIGVNNGVPCFGLAKKWSRSQIQTFVDANIATADFEADAFVQFSAIASAEASTHAEVGLTVTNNPQFDVKFSPPRVKLDAQVQFELEAGFSSSVEKRLELSARSKVYSKIFMLAGVPILVEGTAQAVAIGVIEGTTSAEALISYTINGWIDFANDLEVKLDLSNGEVTVTNPTSELVRSFDDNWEYNFAGSAELSVNANIGVELIMTVSKLVAITIFPSVKASMEVSAGFGPQQCGSSGILSIEGSMEAKKTLEITAGLDEATANRRRLGDNINFWNLLESMCESLNEELGCGSVGGCSDVVGIFRDLGVWDGEIPIPADFSFELLAIESPAIKTEMDNQCLQTSQTSTSSLTAKLSTAPCPNNYEMKGAAVRGGSVCQDTCPAHCMQKHHIQPDGSKQLQCGPICEVVGECPKSHAEWTFLAWDAVSCWSLQHEHGMCDLQEGDANFAILSPFVKHCPVTCAIARGESCPVSKWRVAAKSVHNGGSNFQRDWWGPNDSKFRVVKSTDAQIEEWKDHSRCGPHLQSCKNNFNMNGYFVESSNGECVMPLNCHDAGFSDLAGFKIATWLISARSRHAGGSYFERVWEGPKTAKFRFAQATADNFESLAQDPICGQFISYCRNTFNLYGFYVQASNGQCVLSLNCHDAGYSNLAAVRHL